MSEVLVLCVKGKELIELIELITKGTKGTNN